MIQIENCPHKILINLQIKVHQLLPTGECDVPEKYDNTFLLSYDTNDKKSADLKIEEILEKIKICLK